MLKLITHEGIKKTSPYIKIKRSTEVTGLMRVIL